MNQRSVLVVGAGGRFGSAAVQAFTAAGWRVQTLSLRAGATPKPPAGVVDVLVYAANPDYTRWDEELLPLARQGMDLAQRLGAVFMLPGNVYGFGQGMPALLRADTPEQPTTRKGELRRQMEAELAERAGRNERNERNERGEAGEVGEGLRSVVIRAGDFYGHGSGNWFDLVIAKKLGQGKAKAVYPGPLDVAHAWAYLPDLARAFVAVAERLATPQPGDARHTRLHFAGHTLTGTQLLDGLEAAALALDLPAAGAGLRRSRMPWAPVRLAGLFVPMLRELARMSYLWRVPHALDGTALQQLVGPLPATPVDLALQRALLALQPGPPAPGAAAGPLRATH